MLKQIQDKNNPNQRYFENTGQRSLEQWQTLNTLADPYATLNQKRQYLMAVHVSGGKQLPQGNAASILTPEKINEYRGRAAAQKAREDEKSIFTRDDAKKMSDLIYSTFFDQPRSVNNRVQPESMMAGADNLIDL